MPSFGDGHAHPLPGGLEAVGPQVRQCKSVDEIVAEVKRFAAEHPDDEWIVGASYESSMAPAGLFDARWLDAAVPDRPVVLRAWDYHTVWCNSVALERAGITADTPDPVLGEIPRREDGSPLGTLREWGAVDLVHKLVPDRDPKVRIGALRTAAEYYLARGVTWVQDDIPLGRLGLPTEAARAILFLASPSRFLYDGQPHRHFRRPFPPCITLPAIPKSPSARSSPPSSNSAASRPRSA